MRAQRPNTDGVCPGGQKACGAGSPSNLICVLDNDPCPVNQMKVIQQTEPTPEGWGEVNFPREGWKLIWSSESTELPTVQFRLTEGKVCADKEEYDKSANKKFYKLLNSGGWNGCETLIGGEQFDTRYEYLSSINEWQLYELNGVNQATRNLPYYDEDKSRDYNWNWYSNSMFPWSLSCENEGITREDFYDNISSSIKVADG